MAASLEKRRHDYTELSNRLAHLDNKQLSALMEDESPAHGWGRSHVVKIGASKVFVKRIPVTAPEQDHQFSTENLYHLPTFYNYGVGSAGFGAYRELVTHIKTTNWVLEGAIENFPLMYHFRIVPFTGKRPDRNVERDENYVRYWNNDENIGRYMSERNNAAYEAMIFLEYIPNVLHNWIARNSGQWESVIEGMRRTIAFLREKGVLHFDAHFGNILVEDGTPFLTDFGLALDRNFALDAEERRFFNRHIDYDSAEFLCCVGTYLSALYRNLPLRAKTKVMKRYAIREDTDWGDLVSVLLKNIEGLSADGLMELNKYYVEHIVRHRSIILIMHDFYGRLRRNNKKNAPYPQAELKRLFKETEWGTPL